MSQAWTGKTENRVSKDKDSFYYLAIKNNKIRPKADKKAYIGRRAISLCPWKHSHESKFKMTQIFEHLFSNLTSGEVSKRNHFNLEIFSWVRCSDRVPG